MHLRSLPQPLRIRFWPSRGFYSYFPRNSPMRFSVLCANMRDMNLSHMKQRIAATRSRDLLRVVRHNASNASDRVPWKGMPESDRACISTTALAEKLSDFPRPAFQSGENPMICRLWHNPEARLTVKFRNTTPRIFLPTDLPSNRFAWGDRCR